MEYSDLVYTCALNRIFNYDCKLARKLAGMFPAPETLFLMDKGELTGLFGAGSPYLSRLSDKSILEDADREVEWAASKNVRVICYNETDYPFRLKECPDAPLLLFLAGNADLNAEHAVSVVGTRRASPRGEDICRQIVRELARVEPEPMVVSGLAYGIDICAHREAMAAGLQTVGVMATGINEIYPAAHRADAAAMCSCGGILTDFWRGAPPSCYNFLRRNRIIAGLCDAVVLVESDKKGGGVVTSRMAFSYSREVFAVPGRITDKLSLGCNALISEKIADIVTYPGRIPSAMGWNRRPDRAVDGGSPELFASDSEVKQNIIVALAGNDEMDTDSVIRAVNSDNQSVIAALTELELDGRIRSDDRGLYSLRL